MLKKRNIWFRCPACDGKLVVDAVAGGRRATCPECASDIPVPGRSTMLPSWLKDGAVYATVAFLLAGAAGGGAWVALSADQVRETRASEPHISIARDAQFPGAPLTLADETPTQTAARDEDRAQSRALEEENLQLNRQYEELTRWMIENYQGKYPLPERMVNALRLDMVTKSGEISPDLTEILRLSDEEKGQVKSAIDNARMQIRQTERDLVTVTEQSELRISYEVPVFPEVGRILRDDMFYSLENTLGAPRFDRMLDVAGESMRQELHYFGEASRTLTFEIVMPANEGDHPPYLMIRDGWMVPDGESARITTVKETAALVLPENYRDYQDWIPDNFSAYTLQ